MIRTFLAALLVAVGIGGPSPTPVPPAGSAEVPKSVLGVLWNDTGFVKARFTQLEPLSLEPVGPRIRLRPGGSSASAVSPNRRLLALGTGAPGIQVIDVRRMREVAFVRLGGTGWVTHVFWEHGLVFAVVEGDRSASLVLVDPVGWDVVRRDPLAGMVVGADVGSEEGTGQVVLLTAPRRHVGPVTITVAGGTGGDSVVVPEISGGSETSNTEDGYHARQVIPGLAIDQAGKRALIVPAGRTVAEVSLDDLAIRYHTLSQPVSLLGRLRNWLEPAAEAKLIEGPQRKAAWLGNGLAAVTGADYSTVKNSDGQPDVHVQAAGLSLLDTNDWTIRKVDEETSDFSLFDSSLLAFGDTSWGDPTQKAIGLRGYDLTGRELFHVFDGRRVGGIEASGDLAYVSIDERRRIVLDAASGRVLGRAKAAGTSPSVLPD
jgi:hypothetical protein